MLFRSTELINQARAGLCQIATGSYVGTGTYGQNNPTVINCGFRPKMVFIFTPSVVDKSGKNYIGKNGGNTQYNSSLQMYSNNAQQADISETYTNLYALMDNNLPMLIWLTNRSYGIYDTDYAFLTKIFSDTGILYFVDSYVATSNNVGATTDYRRPEYQFNTINRTYTWLAIG